jgi:hypothetical protein
VHDELTAGYGRSFSVRSDDGRRYYWYAHCHKILVKLGDKVREGQNIALVGSTGFKRADVGPHLHFEVSATPYPKPKIVETSLHAQPIWPLRGEQPDHTLVPRLDPVEELERLGPWGMRSVYLPTVPAEGNDPPIPFTQDAALEEHLQVVLRKAGYYPLGANNTWHGGVHLSHKEAAPIFAPFDADIVALRLDADPVTSKAMYGSTNFILLRHELSPHAARMFRGKHPTDDDDPTPGGPGGGGGKKVPLGVGRGATNLPDDVIALKLGLHAHLTPTGSPYYDPADDAALVDPDPDDRLFAAIDAFQLTQPRPKKMKKSRPWPDGVVTRGGYTWRAIFGPEHAPAPSRDGAREGGDTPEPEAPIGGDTPEPKAPIGGDTPEPPPPLDPRRTVYCLLMHLGAADLRASAAAYDWLATARANPRAGNDDDVAARERADARAADELEAAERKLKKQVGFPAEAPDADPGDTEEIRWVQKRLTRFGFYSGALDGLWSDALREAIAAFQSQYVDYYADPAHPAPGYITAKGDTAKQLRRPKWKLDGEAAGGDLDPVFAARVAERGADGRATVVSGLSIPVRAGQPLWPGGKLVAVLDGANIEFDQLHLEFFSEHPLTDGDTLVDDTEDLVLDVPDALFNAVEIVPGFARDRRLEAGEVQAFYRDERSHFLRRTQCKFRSEWDLDIPGWLRWLDDGGFGTDGIADALEAHMMWSGAADVLPASSHVWHYNPIEFLGRYAEILRILGPRPPVAPGKCALVVHVHFSDGQPWSGARVQLSLAGEANLPTQADVRGLAVFTDVRPGAWMVWLDEHVYVASFVEVDDGDSFVVVQLDAPIPGPAISTATLDVEVVGPGGAPASGVEVVLFGGADVEPIATDAAGRVTFTMLPPGEYGAMAMGVSSATLELVASMVGEVRIELELGEIAVQVRYANGAPAAGQAVNVQSTETGDAHAERSTDPDGIATFEVVAGTYDVWVHGVPEAWETVEVTLEATTPVALLIPLADTPTNAVDRGGIDVFVRDELGTPRAGELVWLLDDANLQLASETTAADGRTRFDDLDEGTYGISAEHGLADELGIAVTAGKRAQIAVRLGAPKPAAKPTGTLLVTVAYEDGAEFDGTLKVTRANYSSLVSRRVTGSFVRVEDVEAGPIVVFVDGFDREVRLDLPPNVDVPVILMLPGFP